MTPESPNKILVVQLRRLGDVILTTPALSALKKRYPAATLDFLVEEPGAEAVAGHPAIDEILVYDAKGPLDALAWALKIRARRYDWVIDFLANPRTALLTALSGAKVKAGPAHVRRSWAYNHKMIQSPNACYAALEKVRWLSGLSVAPDDAPALPQLFLAKRPQSIDNVVGLVPPSRQVTRRWPAASYARLGRLLRDKHGCRIKVFWGPGEKELADEVARGIGAGAEAIAETRTIAELARELASCRVVVSNCAGPKHVAVALGVPTVTIHGSSDPASWTPLHPDHRFVRLEELECIGCRSNTCPYQLECLRQLPVERVLPVVEELLARTGAPA
ncbi:MAG: glycosyltransferase family 9 protein [Elusimicrobiota bacterium]